MGTSLRRPDALQVTRLVALNAALGLISIAYGFDYALPTNWRGFFYRCVTAVLLLILLGLMQSVVRDETHASNQAVSPRLVLLLCLAQVSLTLFFNLPTRGAVLLILVLWLVTFLLARSGRVAVAIAGAVAIGLTAFGVSLAVVPPTTPGADMLPFIAHAIDVFRAGGDPYVADYSAIDDNPFFYPPSQWLIYLPLRSLGLDLRLLNLASAVAAVALVERWARQSEAGTWLRAGVYPVLLGPMALAMMHSGQVWPYWLTILAFGLLILHEHWVTAAVVVAVAVGLRQTALVPAAAVMTALLGRVRFAAWGGAVAAAALVLIVTVAPFVSSAGALHALVLDGPARALQHAHEQGNPDNQIASSNLLDWLGFAAWDSRVEILLAALTVVMATFAARKGTGPMLAAAGLGYAVTISFNPYMHSYYYVAGFLLAGIGIAASNGDAARQFRMEAA